MTGQQQRASAEALAHQRRRHMMADTANNTPLDSGVDEILGWDNGGKTKTVLPQSSVAPSRPSGDTARQLNLRIDAIATKAAETIEQLYYRQDKINAARNPLYQAAKPLLRTLADLPKTHFESHIRIETLRRIMQREVSNFEMLCTKANIDPKHVRTASYCLCTALDEAANSTKWGGGTARGEVGPWASGMLAQFHHGDIDGGRKFFLLVGRLTTAQPEQHRDLLEVMYHILSLGFQGQYRTAPDGRQHLATIRKRLDALITAGREPVPLALSPHLQSVSPDRFQTLRSLPVWVTATVMTLAVLGTFGYYKYQLSVLRNQVAGNIAAIGGSMTAPPAAPSPSK